MKNYIELYIDNKKADLLDNTDINFNYSVEDLDNPTAVKNNYSLSITLPSTKNNNEIFGYIYNLDRIQSFSDSGITSVYFNPLIRTPFSLFNNGSVIEDGYMQLNEINQNNNTISYDITLYGGVGDFFYSLSFNEDKDDRLQLRDLYWKIEDASGSVLPKESEFNFIINKDIVYNSFSKTFYNDNNNKLLDNLSFVPVFNGKYDDFSNNASLINMSGITQDIFKPSISVNSVTYEPYNGFCLGELNKDYTEFETRDLRSYMQHPAIKFSKFLKTISDRDNNGGWDVVLDESFFNSNNPYYNDAFILLPLLGTNLKDNEQVTSAGAAFAKSISSSITEFNQSNYVGYKTNESLLDINFFSPYLSASTSDYYTRYDGFYVDASNVPDSSLVSFSIPMQLFAKMETMVDKMPNDLFLSCDNYSIFDFTMLASIFAKIEIYDLDGDLNTPVYKTPLYNFTNKAAKQLSKPSIWVNQDTAITQGKRIDILGHFKLENKTTGRYIFTNDDDNQTFDIKIENQKKINHFYIRIIIGYGYNSNLNIATQRKFCLFENPKLNSFEMNERAHKSFEYYDYYVEGDSYESTTFNLNSEWKTPITSGVEIKKEWLLRTDITPLDYLLSYTKMFGLYFYKEVGEKKIFILSRNTFFNKNVIDLTNLIDYEKSFNISPVLFDKKYQLFSIDGPETYYYKRYNVEYEQVYGQKRLNTGYMFNSSENNLLNDGCYENIIDIRDNSKYYRSFFNESGETIPAWINDNAKLSYYKTVSGNLTEETKDYYGKNIVDVNQTKELYKLNGYFNMILPCLFDKDNDDKSLSDVTNSIIMFNGRKDLTSADDTVYNITVSDDLFEMNKLNGEACWLYTKIPFNNNGNRIAYIVSYLPQFTRCIYDDQNNTIDSLDFGKPRELFNNAQWMADVSLFERFYKNFLEDQCSVNTRKVTCYVNLNNMTINQTVLRNIYYFNNSYWLMNKIDNYSLNNFETTRCEFIKINNVNNYFNGQKSYN